VTQLTAHFALEEFQKDDPIPPECVPIVTELCQSILEAVRDEFHARMTITSGYRSKKANAEAHGQPNSEHLWTTLVCACDFEVESIGHRLVFDWMRQNPRLPFHQLILESDPTGSSIIHVSLNKMMPGIRSVLVGATHNATEYQKVDYVAFAASAKDVDA
jgi:Peptidase M15